MSLTGSAREANSVKENEGDIVMYNVVSCGSMNRLPAHAPYRDMLQIEPKLRRNELDSALASVLNEENNKDMLEQKCAHHPP